MSEKKDVSYGYESALFCLHRIIRWLVCVIVVLILALVGTNLAWVIYENSFQDEVVEVEQETEDGDNNFIGEDGIIINK